MAEGSPKANEALEPASRLHTATFKAVIDESEKAKSAAETGLVSAVNLNAEGKDNDDIQDSALSSGETEPEMAKEKKMLPKSDKPTTVLIVEDTLELAEIISATLERMDMKTVHETHGNRALTKFNELNPEVVLLDIGLPDMTGWKIMDAIKQRLEETNGRMPIVIVITAYDDPANRLVGKLQGIHSYLIKPFTSDEIEKAVTQALSGAAG